MAQDFQSAERLHQGKKEYSNQTNTIQRRSNSYPVINKRVFINKVRPLRQGMNSIKVNKAVFIIRELIGKVIEGNNMARQNL